jgi:hypothetical protein
VTIYHGLQILSRPYFSFVFSPSCSLLVAYTFPVSSREVVLCYLPRIGRRGFEILTAVVMSSIFWDITPCSPLKVSRRFGGTYRLHIYGLLNRVRNQSEGSWHAESYFLCLPPALALISCLAYSTLNPQNAGDMFLRNFGWIAKDYTELYPRRQNSSYGVQFMIHVLFSTRQR